MIVKKVVLIVSYMESLLEIQGEACLSSFLPHNNDLVFLHPGIIAMHSIVWYEVAGIYLCPGLQIIYLK